MLVTLLKSKIHRATVTASDLHYEGSISIDKGLMDAVGIMENEKVSVWNVDKGTRFETYAIGDEAGSGVIQINGAAAHLAKVEDKIIICAFAEMDEKDAKGFKPRIVMVDEKNRVV